MGVKIYSLREAPEVPSPEVPAPTPGDVVAVGEAYENVSMLEFACLIHDYEQNMFEAVIATDFMEAVQEQVMLEADGEEAAADSNADAGDAGEAKPSLGDKIKNSKAADTARAIKDKIVELIKAFIRKIEEWVQKLRVKFGDLFKVDTKIANWMNSMDFSDVEKDARWKAPSVNYSLMNAMFEERGFDVILVKYFNEAENAMKKLGNAIKSARSIDLGTAVDEIKTAEEEAKKALNLAKTNVNGNIENIYNMKEVGKSDNGMKAVSINKAKTWFNTAVKGEGITGIVKAAEASKANLKKMESEIQSFTAEDPAINKVAMAAYNSVITDYTNMISKATTTLASAQARAYADLRKFCLAAVALKKKMLNGGTKTKETPEVKAAKEAFELESWAICEASDEYVFSTLELI